MQEPTEMPADALRVAQATLHLLTTDKRALADNFGAAMSEHANLHDSATPSEIAWLANAFLDGIFEIVGAGSVSATLKRPMAEIADRLGRDRIVPAFRISCRRSLDGATAAFVIGAWCELVAACCALLPPSD